MCWCLQARPSPSPSNQTRAVFIRGKRPRWNVPSASPDLHQRLAQPKVRSHTHTHTCACTGRPHILVDVFSHTHKSRAVSVCLLSRLNVFLLFFTHLQNVPVVTHTHTHTNICLLCCSPANLSTALPMRLM